jgi:antitoxin PrlF
MPTATLSSKGQITLPKKVRERLKVQTGDAIEFVIGGDGEVRVRAGQVDVTQLRGFLHSPGRKPVSLERMDLAIRRARTTRR